MKSNAQKARGPQAPPPIGLTLVSRSTETRASNAARAALVVANVTPTGYRVGIFMANHARYAKPEDIRRNVVPGELFTYWPQAKMAAAMGCSERQVRRGVRSMREAGALEVRRRVRPCEASYVWVLPVRSDGAGVRSESACVLSGVRSGVLSGVRSHTEPRTEPQKNHEGSSTRAREDVPLEPEQDPTRWYCSCGNVWLKIHGTLCHPCKKHVGSKPTAQRREKPETQACTCGPAYRGRYERLCVDCKGEPSSAQQDALQEKHGGGGVPGNEEEGRYLSKADPEALSRFWEKARAQLNSSASHGGNE